MDFFATLFFIFIGLSFASLLGYVWWQVWVRYINSSFINSIKWVMLEVKLPRDVYKSPLAMEVVLNALYQTGGTGDNYAKFWLGKLRNWFSLEIASIEGEVHFFIRTNAQFKNSIEAAIYSQYPGIEIHEVDDYTNAHRYDPEKYNLFGTQLKLAKDDFLPIRTYVDYGLDKDQKEEYKIDPLTALLEWMGSIGKGENLWLQILVRADTSNWHEKGQEEIDKLYDVQHEETIKEGKKVKKKISQGKKDADLTQVEKDKIDAIRRNIQKIGFETMIRVVYLTNKDKFNPGNIPMITGGCMRQFNWQHLNGFGVKGGTVTSFDFPWQDFSGKKVIELKKDIFAEYVHRKAFYETFSDEKFLTYKYFKNLFVPGDHNKGFILNLEELATIYHFPGQVAHTPTFKRISSTKAEPPANLPL